MRISDWSSDVCSSDLVAPGALISIGGPRCKQFLHYTRREARRKASYINAVGIVQRSNVIAEPGEDIEVVEHDRGGARQTGPFCDHRWHRQSVRIERSEEHKSELQSLMRISYAVFCLQKKKVHDIQKTNHQNANL